MNHFIAIAYILFSNICFGQVEAVIKDSQTNLVVPYVNIWVEGENKGTTSNENGFFQIQVKDEAFIVFSAVGYETKKVKVNSITDTVQLVPVIVELEEVFVSTKKMTKEYVLGKFKKSKVNHYFVCSGQPWISARFYKYKNEYENYPFLEKIKILTKSKIEGAKFKLRFYDVKDNGEPGDLILNQNIIGMAKKGKKITEIDLTNLNFRFPKNGFFIAVEWLIIENNKYVVTNSDFKDYNVNMELYQPALGTIQAKTNDNSWIYIQGKWRKIWSTGEIVDEYKNNYSLPAIELTLTN